MILARRFGLAVALLSALASGCTSWAQKAWPPYPETVQAGEGAILLKLTSAAKMSGFRINSVLLMWPDAGETGPHKWSSSQHLRLIGRVVDGGVALPDDVVLCDFKPGTYSRLIVRLFFTGQEMHYIDVETDKPLNLSVEPGKVSVLGRLDLSTVLDVTGFTDKGTEFDIKSKVRLDDGPDAKAALLREALTRPEADSSRWRAALDDAQSALPTGR